MRRRPASENKQTHTHTEKIWMFSRVVQFVLFPFCLLHNFPPLAVPPFASLSILNSLSRCHTASLPLSPSPLLFPAHVARHLSTHTRHPVLVHPHSSPRTGRPTLVDPHSSSRTGCLSRAEPHPNIPCSNILHEPTQTPQFALVAQYAEPSHSTTCARRIKLVRTLSMPRAHRTALVVLWSSRCEPLLTLGYLHVSPHTRFITFVYLHLFTRITSQPSHWD